MLVHVEVVEQQALMEVEFGNLAQAGAILSRTGSRSAEAGE